MNKSIILASRQANLPSSWNQVIWSEVYEYVDDCRGKIFTYSRNGLVDELRTLQIEMMEHPYTLLAAIRRVTSRSARETPGIDNAIVTNSEDRWEIFSDLQELNLAHWYPPPVKRIYILKADKKRWRPLGIPTISDRVIQAVIFEALEPEWEAKFEACSYGFRPGRGRADALARAFIHLSASPKLQPGVNREWVVVADVKGCFDSVSHPALLQILSDFPAYELIKRWLKAGILEEDVFAETEIGFPQGGVISPLLCNIALTGLEGAIQIEKPRPVLIRYADDFVILCKSYEGAKAALNAARTFLATRGLEFKDSKDPPIVHITQGFDLLGCTFKRVSNYGFKKSDVIPPRIEDDTLVSLPWYSEARQGENKRTIVLVSPSKSLKTRFKANIKEVFISHRGSNIGSLIRTLNPKIQGFARSVQTVNCTQTFREIDSYIFRLTVRYLRRAHLAKSWDWIKSRYFVSSDQYKVKSNWILKDPQSSETLLCLRFFTKINHSLIRGDICPDDPSAEVTNYFKQRLQRQFDTKQILLFSGLDRDLSLSQKHICPVCKRGLHISDSHEKLHRHHILERRLGGTDTFGNLVLLHSSCHDSIHYSNNDNYWYEHLKLFKKYHPKINRKKSTGGKSPPGLKLGDNPKTGEMPAS